MLLRILTWLSTAINGEPAIALTAAFLWGICSIILSPCHLASIPLIVGFIGNQGTITTKRAFWLSFLFSSGILFTIALIGIITGLLGRMLGDIGAYGNYFVAAIFFIVGLYLLGVIPLNFLGSPGQPALKRKGYLAAFILGFIFGIALGPCTFAYMMPVLGVAFSLASTNFLYAVTLVLMYALGHCGVITFAGTFSEYIQRLLHWNEKSRVLDVIKKICGVLVIFGGVYLIITAKG